MLNLILFIFIAQLAKEIPSAQVGGNDQAIKDVSYMQTAAPCKENAVDATYCSKVVAGGKCGHPQARLTCPVSCGYCTASQYFTVGPACIAGTSCTNTTYCNKPAGPLTDGTCTQTGAADGSSAKGYCEKCSNCTQGKACPNGDSDCGGAYKSCGLGSGEKIGTCGGCPTNTSCVFDKKCYSDLDCGGVIGSCMQETKDTNNAYIFIACPSSGAENCKCKICPNGAKCKNHGQTCKAATAVTDCGDANYCRVDVSSGAAKDMSVCLTDSAACLCACKPEMSTAGDPTKQTGTGFPICLQGTKCTQGEEQQCGGKTVSEATPCKQEGTSGNYFCSCATDMPKPYEAPSICSSSLNCTLPAADESLECVDPAVSTDTAFKSNLKASVCQQSTDKSLYKCQCGVQVPLTSARLGAPCWANPAANSEPPQDCDANSFCSEIDIPDSGAPTVLNTPCTMTFGTSVDTKGCQCVSVEAAVKSTRADYDKNKQKCYSDWSGICGYGTCVKYSDMLTPCDVKAPVVAAVTTTTVATTTTTEAAGGKRRRKRADTDTTAAPECVCKAPQCSAGAECSLSEGTPSCGGEGTCKGACSCK